MLFVYFNAPFGVSRIHQSIETSITSDFLTHSAAYGLLLGLAGIERDKKQDFTDARIAVGVIGENLPKRGSIYQQLHSAIGANVADFERTKGTKPNIRPVVREVLISLEGYIGLDHAELEQRVSDGIDKPEGLNCWGIPFLGDNNFFLEKLEVSNLPHKSCRWFTRYTNEQVVEGERLHYLSVWTDYEDNSRSHSLLFSLSQESEKPPPKSWIMIGENQV